MKKVLLQTFLLLTLCLPVFAQTRSVTGKVVGKDDELLVGATVTVKGTKTVTTTDVGGNFKLIVPASGNVTLVATYVGLKPQEVSVRSQNEIVIIMSQDDARVLEEVKVVNIGYATVSKNAVTGAVSSVGAKDIRDFPVSTTAEALAGKLAGVTVTTTEGKPGADMQIRVRGGSSITQDNSPLYIVDGIQVENALAVISPQEIQSIDVLKDVASTAIYGARGANGVVLITTKSGRNARTLVSFSSYAGVRKITNELPVLNPYDYVQYQYQIYNLNTDQATKDAFTKTYGTFDDLDIYKNYTFSDWQNKVFGRDALSHTENLNINGGTKTSSFNFTVNNFKEDGIIAGMMSELLKRRSGCFSMIGKNNSSLSGIPEVCPSNCLMVTVGYGNSGKYLTNVSSIFNLPFPWSCKTATAVNVLDTEPI
ncbi:TonB-dependent receptor plug domain-containing protein [Mucilaginibacter sabulilitoris]|uniref:TonB-dependent receptor plug domain-containing protein n=1 Tax=Mucilaginibacter sabulilitoris TaxID=1173583 RepID=A0ABZ0TXW6_9SPHI|nr:TonB-dependent receptor plug domain-containing protein [Mucilaginibacter sabulilitoris]WPU96998.1 TonB-dependent receptor plug domain-containing protein [Mucilaginibacter sabulilitoris]